MPGSELIQGIWVCITASHPKNVDIQGLSSKIGDTVKAHRMFSQWDPSQAIFHHDHGVCYFHMILSESAHGEAADLEYTDDLDGGFE